MSLAISVGQHDRIQGFATASVTLVEYGDYDASAAEQLINNHAVRSTADSNSAITSSNKPLVAVSSCWTRCVRFVACLLLVRQVPKSQARLTR
jgi:hypothetical protein